MNQKKPKPIFNEVISKVAEKTFGELAFMLTMPQDDDLGDSSVVWGYGASVAFTGPFSGKLFVSISMDMMDPLAVNMLGLEPGEDPPEGVMIEDGLKELLNVICGNLLPAIAGEKVIFNISGPELLDDPTPPESLEGNRRVGQCRMLLDSGSACLGLFVDERADFSTVLQ